MRVIGGEFRSRRLKTIPGIATRPTPDRLRETLFDILAPRIRDVLFLDAYAGTGAVGIEALSRGARQAIFIEKNHAPLDALRVNLKSLGLEERAQVFCGKARVVLARLTADIVFLDPPYDAPEEYAAVLGLLGNVPPPPLIVAQHSVRQPLEERYGALRRVRTVRQSDNALSFYQKTGDRKQETGGSRQKGSP
ncbi:MAG: 16S rRNA (guanine(966)-N(2))-methyltransferase RsmD [Bryobacteraceae bacterium]|jgi:16S rRNA (guanine(966)-N(2))-methyltransferase RsmD